MRASFCLLALVSLLFMAGCVSGPEGVLYLTNIDDSESDDEVEEWIEDAEQTAGVNPVLIVVLNTASDAAVFSLAVRDEQSTRQVWKRERVTEGVSMFEFLSMDTPISGDDEKKLSRSSRVAVIRVQGSAATLIINEAEHEVKIGDEPPRMLFVTLSGDDFTVIDTGAMRSERR